MGLIQIAKDTVTGMVNDQLRECFHCDSLDEDILVARGMRKVDNGRNNNTKSLDNLISNGSIILVNHGQCAIIVDQGQVVEFCAEPGEFIYDSSTEPSILYGNFTENIKALVSEAWRRATLGGNTGREQRVYYFNTKEIMGNLFGTATPISYKSVHADCGLTLNTQVKCNGEYSFKIENPLVFFTNVCGNVVDEYNKKKEPLMGMMRTEFVSALQPALGRLAGLRIPYDEIPNHTLELEKYMQEILTEKWLEQRGIQVVRVAFNPTSIPQADLDKIAKAQEATTYSDVGRARGMLVSAQAEAMQAAASNEATGPMMAFAGMNMANMAGGMNLGQMFAMDAPQSAPQPQVNMGAATVQQGTPIIGWTCSCGNGGNTGKFCSECGQPKPADAGWTCGCGTVNQGKFCQNCGSKKPEGAPIYKCDKCGWEPEDPANPPKFCPECGDVFDDNDKK